ncbi:hypothetical protein DBR21_18665 [Caulobacter sp. HMWF009]|nr:hypothetical protein DBR21_18665 [Caulobacter sp. HMWF009]PTT08933.1 hypothetical protein DBR10_08060 [Caulobacter sp. HMWF025]
MRPLEWFRLAALHGPLAFLLHDDFYSEDGVADQNRIPVQQAGLFPAPTLDSVRADLQKLFDYTFTRWRLEAPVVAALNVYAPEVLLRTMSQRMLECPIPWIESRCFEVAATLGPAARDWVRANWANGTKSATLYAFLKSAAACLPAPEAVPQALQAVEAADGGDISVTALALVDFHSPQVLDWIERTVRSPVSDRWGYLAARSSLTWAVAARWLSAGRPTSLVALDALLNVYCAHPSVRHPIPAELPDQPGTPLILQTLHDAALVDPVPRVEKAVAAIVRSIAG